MADTSPIISAFTEDQVRRLTGVSAKQLRTWAADGFFRPSIELPSEEFGSLRLYGFRDLVCLRIIGALRNGSKVPFSELRKTKERLAHLGEDLWAKTTLYVLGKRVVFKNTDTGEKEEVSSGQGVLRIPLQIVAGEMHEAIRAMRQRNPESVGRIEQKRGLAQNQHVVSGTRIPVRTIQDFHKAGYSNDEIQAQYPSLTAKDIEAAINFKEVA